jgi:hypothetical protein
MNRTPLLPSFLWTAIWASGAAVSLAACETEEPNSTTVDGPVALVPSFVPLSVECGSAEPAAPALFRIFNPGNEVLRVTGAAATNGFVVIGELPVEVQPGFAVSLAVRAPAAVIGTDVGGTVKTGKLTLETNDPRGNPEIELRSAIHGANLVLTNAQGMPLPRLDLTSESQSSCPPPASVFVKNTGDKPSVVTVLENDYPIERVSDSSTVAAGASAEFEISPTLGGGCQTAGQVVYQVTGSVCSAAPILQVTQQVGGTSTCFCGGSSSAV